jgi:hypothetical protein
LTYASHQLYEILLSLKHAAARFVPLSNVDFKKIHHSYSFRFQSAHGRVAAVDVYRPLIEVCVVVVCLCFLTQI